MPCIVNLSLLRAGYFCVPLNILQCRSGIHLSSWVTVRSFQFSLLIFVRQNQGSMELRATLCCLLRQDNPSTLLSCDTCGFPFWVWRVSTNPSPMRSQEFAPPTSSAWFLPTPLIVGSSAYAQQYSPEDRMALCRTREFSHCAALSCLVSALQVLATFASPIFQFCLLNSKRTLCSLCYGLDTFSK